MIQVVAAVIFNDKNEVFIAKRNKKKSLGGYWEFPGGKIEKGETPEESLIREIKEELDIEIEVEDKFEENIHDYGDFQVNLIAYKSKIKSGHIIANEHEEWKWSRIEELKDYIFAPADGPFVEKLMCDK